MSQSAIMGMAGNTAITTASTTWYSPLNSASAGVSAITTEANAQVTLRCGTCTLQNLNTRVQADTWASAVTITIDQNGTGTALVNSLTTTGTVTDATHTLSCADTDKITFATATPAGTGSITIAATTMEQVQSSGQVATILASCGSLTSTSTTNTGLSGQIKSGSIQPFNSICSAEAFTLSNAQLYVAANGSAGFTAGSLITNVAGNQTLSVGSAATGLFEDTTHTDAVSASTYYAMHISSCTVSRTVTVASMKYLSGTSGVSSMNAGYAATANGARYQSLFGNAFVTSTESQLQAVAPQAATMSKLCLYVYTNAETSAGTLNFRKASANGNQVVSIGASTGFLQDATNTDSVAAGDLIDTGLETISGGNVVYNGVTMLSTISSGGGGSTAQNLGLLGVGN